MFDIKVTRYRSCAPDRFLIDRLISKSSIAPFYSPEKSQERVENV